MAFSRVHLPAERPASRKLTREMAGLGMNFAATPLRNANIENALLFDRHSAELKPPARALLEPLARDALDEILLDMVVEGHADRSPLPEDSRFANHLELTAARAFAVMQYILDHSKIPQKQLSCHGRGFRDADPERPDDPAHNCVELIIDTKIKTK